MIDSKCPIWKAGKGMCWCPSEAWGLTDQQVCICCKLKQAAIREPLVIPVTLPLVAVRNEPQAADIHSHRDIGSSRFHGRRELECSKCGCIVVQKNNRLKEHNGMCSACWADNERAKYRRSYKYVKHDTVRLLKCQACGIIVKRCQDAFISRGHICIECWKVQSKAHRRACLISAPQKPFDVSWKRRTA